MARDLGKRRSAQRLLAFSRRRPGRTALREANEELGLVGDRVELLAALPVVETQTTGFRIAPFLARLAVPVPWRLQGREIAEVAELRVADLARPEVRAEEVRDFPTWPAPRRVRLWRVGHLEVWGDLPDPGAAGPATAGRGMAALTVTLCGRVPNSTCRR
jgi:8-oxo-dGTP pyrophosphatase MutT (NUDIX family)